MGGDTGSRSIDKEKNAAAAEAKGHGKNAWCTPPPPWPWEDGDNVVAGPSGWLGGKEGELLSQIQDGKQGPRAPEQGSLSRYLFLCPDDALTGETFDRTWNDLTLAVTNVQVAAAPPRDVA